MIIPKKVKHLSIASFPLRGYDGAGVRTMKEINLGQILIEQRHRKGITQDELAAHVGVSKGAVSKWETGSSLPDISLLPRLASYFDISVDDLIGYRPRMEKDSIRKLYIRLSRDFSALPFDRVLAECLETGKKYYSCYPLLLALGTLLINHTSQTPSPGQVTEMIGKALEWFQRVRTMADEPKLRKEALHLESLCLLHLQRPAQVIDILEPDGLQTGSAEPLLAMAYQMTGNDREAGKILQAGIYREVMNLFSLFQSYLSLCGKDAWHFSETCQRLSRLVDAFHVKSLHPGILLGLYITIAQGYMALGDTEQALAALTQYTDLALSDIYPLRLHGDRYFDLLDTWFDAQLVPGVFPPRDEALIRRDMTQALSENPAFQPLREDPRFQHMVDRLRTNEEA